jgi:hypothetical protein
MSSPRLFRAQPELSYSSALINTIDCYMDEVESLRLKRAGYDRALELKIHILTTLTRVEQLNDTQLMWRMFEYTGMISGVGPLDTSKLLREKLLGHLLRTLKITPQQIEAKRSEITALEIQAFAASGAASHGSTYVPDYDRILNDAKRALIKKALSEQAQLLQGSLDCQYLITLFNTIENYKLSAAQAWFKGEGLKRADHVSKIVSDWVMVEKLNDRQVLARLYEHLMMPSGQDNGLMGTSLQLRTEIVEGMFTYLKLDEAALAEKVVVAVARSVYTVAAPSGGAVVVEDGAALALKFRLEAINAKLREGTGVENVEILERTDDNIEMRSYQNQ